MRDAAPPTAEARATIFAVQAKVYCLQAMVEPMTADAAPSADEPPGRRERKKRATLLALRAAAVTLATERGFAHVTVEDIAEAADVSVRTFFNYFPSKEAAIIGDVPERTAALRDELRALPADIPPLQALRHVLLQRVEAIILQLQPPGEDGGVWRSRLAALRAQPEVLAAYAKFFAVLERTLGEVVLERLGGEDELRHYAAVVTACALSALRVSIVSSKEEPSTAGLSALTAQAFALLEGGLRPPAATTL